jgi:CheY-like chemotaxis protein
MNRQAKDTYSVLVADDSADDRLLLRAAVNQTARLRIAAEVRDGGEVIAYLRGHDDREKHPLPDLLLLDLKMPVMDGFEVLEWLRVRPFEDLTVVVLTDSMQPEHIQRALQLGADLFQIKPRSNRERETMVMALENHIFAARRPFPAAA